ncbi:MAG: phage holin family protein [Mariniphaga sp.]|nr:phage holin family protein [Mariniphaga sp.]
MKELTTPVEDLLARAQAYTKTSLQLFKLKATDKLAEIISNLASGFVIVVILALFFVNLNIAIALLLGDLFGKIWLGFILVSALYLFIGIIVYLFRNQWIKRPVSNSIILELLMDESLKDDQLPD